MCVSEKVKEKETKEQNMIKKRILSYTSFINSVDIKSQFKVVRKVTGTT